MPHLSILNLRPDLVLAAVVCWALLSGPTEGAVFGFLGGLATDLISGAPFGMHTLAMTIVGAIGGSGADMIPSEHALLLPIVAVLCTVLQQAIHVFVLRSAGWPLDWPRVLLTVVLPSAALNLLLTLLLFPLAGRLHRKAAQEEPGW